MCRKIILFYLWIYILNNSFAQLPISLDSEKELFKNAELIQKKDFHTAIRPYTYSYLNLQHTYCRN